MPDDARNYYRVPGWLRQQAGLGRIGPEARKPAGTAYGLAMENVERAHMHDVFTGGSNYSSLAATSWTVLDATNLAWRVTTSGKRPVEFRLSAWLTSAATQLMGVTLLWDGTEVSGQPYGMAGVYDTSVVRQVSGFAVLDTPGPGTHTLQVAYRVSGGAGGFVQVDASTALFVSAKEI